MGHSLEIINHIIHIIKLFCTDFNVFMHIFVIKKIVRIHYFAVCNGQWFNENAHKYTFFMQLNEFLYLQFCFPILYGK